MSPFEELLNRVYSGDPDRATDDIMTALKLSKHQRDVLREAIRSAVSVELRRMSHKSMAVALEASEPDTPVRKAARDLSRKMTDAPLPTIRLPKAFGLTMPQLRKLLTTELVVRGRRTTWGAATRSDLRTFRDSNRSVARTLMVKADMAEQVLNLLEASGLETLGEYCAHQVAA